MTKLFHFINVPLAWVLRFIADAFNGNFAAAVFIFTLLINIVFIPLTIKSQKSAVQQLRIKPKLDELKKKYGDDKQKYSQAMSQLYQEENVSMSGGCLPMLFRMLVLMSIYSLIMSPLTYLMNVDAGVISEAANALKEAGIEIAKNTRGQGEIQIINAVLNGTISSPEILEAAKNINFNLFGLNLTETPKFSFNIFGDFQAIWLMPIFSFASQMLVSFISTRMQKKANPDAPNMTGMLLMMPLFSLYIGFLVPGGVSFYWVCSSLIGGLLQVVIQHVYGPQRLLAGERAKELAKQCDFEAGQIKKLGNNE
jgi:YidC/Oxa1 family membrane protein insertase